MARFAVKCGSLNSGPRAPSVIVTSDRTGDHRDSRGWFWRIEDRILLLYAEGDAGTEGADWALQAMEEAIAETRERRSGRLFVAWSFENVRHYAPTVGMRFVQWFRTHGQYLNRFMVFTSNSVLRMTARATSIAFRPGRALYPSSARDFDETLAQWCAHVRGHGECVPPPGPIKDRRWDPPRE